MTEVKNYEKAGKELLRIAGVESSESDGYLFTDKGALKAKINEILTWLLEHDMNRLMQLVYRIDLKEEVVRQCFDNPGADQIADCLSEAIIERQMQKIESRAKYRF